MEVAGLYATYHSRYGFGLLVVLHPYVQTPRLVIVGAVRIDVDRCDPSGSSWNRHDPYIANCGFQRNPRVPVPELSVRIPVCRVQAAGLKRKLSGTEPYVRHAQGVVLVRLKVKPTRQTVRVFLNPKLVVVVTARVLVNQRSRMDIVTRHGHAVAGVIVLNRIQMTVGRSRSRDRTCAEPNGSQEAHYEGGPLAGSHPWSECC